MGRNKAQAAAEPQIKPRYFCESCGKEVPPDAKICPYCGRFFAAVRCPKCNFVGTVHDFMNGCPRCHYAISKEELFGQSFQGGKAGKEQTGRRRRGGLKRRFSLSRSGFLDDVPVWLFVTSIIALILILAAVLIRCSQ